MSSDLRVERLRVYDPEVAAGIGILMPHLSSNLTSDPIVESRLRPIIEESSCEQIIAVRSSRVVGSAVLSLVRSNNGPGVRGWLEDFVVHPDEQGRGTSHAIADEWESWLREKKVNFLHFTSSYERENAHKFYFKRGAYIISDVISQKTGSRTAYFEYPIPAV